ncbi:MAG: prepilin-type N-terminal cleavage/methylation domain-containing protein [Magnetococcales bacterium]|nr:prepilin-type N-terminal cleavage/methylation domain-containing protein [Magnetococcales bacterium]
MSLNRKESGFTLLEILIAMLIFSIGLLAMARLQMEMTRGNAASKRITTATLLAEDKIEELKASGFGTLINNTYTDPNNPVTPLGSSGGLYTRTWTIADYEGVTTMKQITVTITWSDEMGAHTLPLTTVVSNTGG